MCSPQNCEIVRALGVGADELHENDPPAEVEGSHQAIISSRNLEPDALAVQHLGFRNRLLHVVSRGPVRGSGQPVPAFHRNLCFRMLARKPDEHAPRYDPHDAE
jgi:hypothetical protein